MFKCVADDWSSIKGKAIKECVHAYLHIAQSIPLYGCKLFKTQVFNFHITETDLEVRQTTRRARK